MDKFRRKSYLKTADSSSADKRRIFEKFEKRSILELKRQSQFGDGFSLVGTETLEFSIIPLVETFVEDKEKVIARFQDVTKSG